MAVNIYGGKEEKDAHNDNLKKDRNGIPCFI